MSDNTSGKTRDVNAVARVTQALKLCAQHKPWDEIASECGYSSRGAAHNAVMRELHRRVVKNVDELRTQELYMLNRLHQECWELAMDKKNKGRLFAVDRVIAISERRAKLMGLDIPVEMAQNNNLVVIREVPQGWLAVEAQKG